MTVASVAATKLREDTGLKTAYRLLWLAVMFDFLAFGVGFDWDRRWHATHAFENFFSPPHLFIYSMHFCATITLAYIAFTPELRRWFGPTFRLPIVPFPIPGAIGLAGAGFAVVAIAGMFDAIWFLAAVGFAFTTAAIWEGTPGEALVGIPFFIEAALPLRHRGSSDSSLGPRRRRGTWGQRCLDSAASVSTT